LARYQTYFVSSNQNSLFLAVRSPSLGDMQLSCDYISIVALKRQCYSSIVLKFGIHSLYTCTSWCGAWTQGKMWIFAPDPKTVLPVLNITLPIGKSCDKILKCLQLFSSFRFMAGKRKATEADTSYMDCVCVYQTHSYVHNEW